MDKEELPHSVEYKAVFRTSDLLPDIEIGILEKNPGYTQQEAHEKAVDAFSYAIQEGNHAIYSGLIREALAIADMQKQGKM